MKIEINLLPYQLKLLKSDKKYLALIGGTGTGKTYFAPRWLYVKMGQYPGEEWIVSAPTIPMLKRNPVKYIEKFFQENKIPYHLNKSDLEMETQYGKIYFISAENPDRMQGIHAKGIIGDEAGMYDMLWWNTAVQRVSYIEGQILLLTTPYSENWLKKEIWEKWKEGDPDIELVNPSSLDNPFYPVSEYERAKRKLPDWRFRMMYEGKFTKPAGLIYPDYEVVDDFLIPSGWYRYRGVDFGFNNPFAVIWLAEDPINQGLYIYKEYKKSGLIIDDMYSVLAGEPDIVTYGDPASKESLETLKAKGINIHAARKDVLNGILQVGSLFRTKRLKVFKSCKYTIDELDSYQWDTDRAGNIIDKPKKENDHLMDALRYIVSSVDFENIVAPEEGEYLEDDREWA